MVIDGGCGIFLTETFFQDCSMDQEESSASKSSPSVPATSGANGVVASK